ncbi:MAG: PQQ-binding-like beta-propeller repeat protein, partial [Hyphomicrobiales bacterium]
MSMAPFGSVGGNHAWRLNTLSMVIACVALTGCVAKQAAPDIAALNPDLETPVAKSADTKVVSNDKELAPDASTATASETKSPKPLAYQFVAKASFDLPALNQEFPSTYGFSGNNIDHLLLGGGASWQSQPTKKAGQVTTPLVLNAGRLFYGDDKGGLHAVSASNGASLWTVRLSDGKIHQPIATLFADQNVLYAATKNGHVIAVSVKDGAILWKKKITGSGDGSIKGALRSLGKTLLLQMGNDQLITLSKDKAEAGWRYKSTHPISSLAVSNGSIQLLDNKNSFLRLDADTGKQKTKNEVSAVVEANQLIATTDDLIISGKNGLTRYTPRRTKILWNQKNGVEG